MRVIFLLVLPLLLAAEPARTSWPMFGGTPSRNPVNLVDRGLPVKFDAEKDHAWKADLGGGTGWLLSYGSPVVAGGKVFVGTNNERPRNMRDTKKGFEDVEPIDRGVLVCFDEKTGKFLWQAVFPKLQSGVVNDYVREGITSTPTVEGDRLYFVSNRCTVVCADVNGLTDGRQGAVVRKEFSDPTDADIHWEYDMIAELKVFPHNFSNCSPLVIGDLVFVCTSNGVDWDHATLPSPDAPSFIALNKKTGKLVWKSNLPGKNVMHGQWSSPAYTADPIPQVIFAGGDGWLYSFDPPTGKLLWKFDANEKDSVYELGGTGSKNDFIAMPCIDKGRLYIATGQDAEHTDGSGTLWCLDIRKATENGAKREDRDVSPELLLTYRAPKPGEDRATVTTKPNPGSAGVWCIRGREKTPFDIREWRIGRTHATTCVMDDILYLTTLSGYIHCIDARTGKEYWRWDARTSIRYGPYYADGKLYLGNDTGDLLVWKHVKEPKTFVDIDPKATDEKATKQFRRAKHDEIAKEYLLAKIEFDGPIRTMPCVANGMLYVMTDRSLYAFRGK